MINDQVIFSSKSLPDDFETLGLLEGIQSLVKRRVIVWYSFSHLVIQEMLCAFHMARRMPPSEQVEKFQQLLNSPRFAAVFQFYSAITQLKTPGINNVINEVASRCSTSSATVEHKVHLNNLLHCLHEAQESSLCQEVAKRLQHGIDLSDITLSPFDCQCIGAFLSSLCPSAVGEIKVNLRRCKLSNLEVRYLVNGLNKCENTLQGAAKALSIEIDLGCNNFSRSSSTNEAYQSSVAAMLRSNVTLTKLNLCECNLSSENVEELAGALEENNTLLELDISRTECSVTTITKLAEALNLNKTLKKLVLRECGISDKELKILSKALKHNISLRSLNLLYNGNIRKAHIENTMTKYIKKNSTLEELVLPRHLASLIASIERAVNGCRIARDSARIRVTSKTALI